jgi:hypothetical protein
VGLALEVGMLADLIENDEEGAEWFREELDKLNGVLAGAGLAPHTEPRESAVFSTDAYGYSGLHHLRRCAAHLHYSGALGKPLEEGEEVVQDALYVRYGAEFEGENADASAGTSAKPAARPFDHLIMHSDAEGFYVPQAFDRVLIAHEQSYGWIGSSYTLKTECERLAATLQIPADLLNDYDNAAFYDAMNKPGKAGWGLFKPRAAALAVWQTLPIAALVCAKLRAFADHSIKTGALLVFC